MLINIITRAWKDPDFKKLLFSNPKAALREMHFPIPENFGVRIVEEGQDYPEDKNTLTIVLPKHPTDAHKLSEKELAVMAGGFQDLENKLDVKLY